MKMLKLSGTIPALALMASLGVSNDAQASTLVVDRGLPDTDLNNAAGGDRSNVAWGSAGLNAPGDIAFGDSFTLPSTEDPSLPSWRVDKLTGWVTAGTPGDDDFELSNSFSDVSLYIGPAGPAGTTIDRVATSSISGNAADAANVTITPVTYADGQNYQGSGGGDIQIWQVDFTDLGTFSAGDYMFGVAGLPVEDAIWFNHASNADLGGVPAEYANDRYLDFDVIPGAGGGQLKLFAEVDSNGNGWDKSSDINVQVHASPVPLPAAGWLLLTAFGGLGLAARRRRKAA